MTQEELFNVFWKAYPKKTAKPKALTAFKKLKPDEDLLNAILAALEKQKQSKNWKKEKGQFVPYPATYLNQRRWEDEPNGATELPSASGTGGYGIAI